MLGSSYDHLVGNRLDLRVGEALVARLEQLKGEADRAHFRRLLSEAVSQQAKVDQLTARALAARWPIDRIDPTLRALFRAAGAELVGADTPPKVTIQRTKRWASASRYGLR